MNRILLFLMLLILLSAGDYPEYPCGWQPIGLDKVEPYELLSSSRYKIEAVAVNMTSNTCFWSTPEKPDSHCFRATFGGITDYYDAKIEKKPCRPEVCLFAYGDVEVVEWYGYLPQYDFIPLVLR